MRPITRPFSIHKVSIASQYHARTPLSKIGTESVTKRFADKNTTTSRTIAHHRVTPIGLARATDQLVRETLTWTSLTAPDCRPDTRRFVLITPFVAPPVAV